MCQDLCQCEHFLSPSVKKAKRIQKIARIWEFLLFFHKKMTPTDYQTSLWFIYELTNNWLIVAALNQMHCEELTTLQVYIMSCIAASLFSLFEACLGCVAHAASCTHNRYLLLFHSEGVLCLCSVCVRHLAVTVSWEKPCCSGWWEWK